MPAPQPYTIAFGPWAPDLANIGVQMTNQWGATALPCADCLNVYYSNAAYRSLPMPARLVGGLIGSQVNGAFTAIDPLGNPLVFVGTGVALYQWNGTGWITVSSAYQGTRWIFAQFASALYAADGSVFAADAVLKIAPAGGQASSTVTTASQVPIGRVLATVGQFLMVGDIGQQFTAYSLGTGDGATRVFTGTLPNVPIRPGTVEPFNNGVTQGPDSGNGGFAYGGTSGYSGSVNYTSGAIRVVFNTAPANTNPITANYTQGFSPRAQWSAIGNADSFPTPLTDAAIAAQSGYEDLESAYGQLLFIAGYPLYAVIFQRNAITRAAYIGGQVVFSFATYARNQGLVTSGAAVQVGLNTYFLADSGFFVTDGANVTPIGTAPDNSAGIDQWFWSNVNESALSAIRAAYDARLRCVFFAIPTGTNTLPDTLLIYNVLSGFWTRAAIATECIWVDSDGTTDRIALFDQAHAYSLLNGPAVSGYLESCDFMFTDGNTRYCMGARPNINCSDIATVTIGNRNNLQASVGYSNPASMDLFSNIAPFMTNGVYTRARVTSSNAQSFHGATLFLQPGGPL